MFFTLLVFATALTISVIAAWYSIVGLTAIFASAVWPVAIMGSALEVAKLVSASWLYRYWLFIPRLIKYYLTSAVIILMFITSMGIFGFLSRAHIEQTSLNTENLAQVERIEKDIIRYKSVIERSEEKINHLENKGTGLQASLQVQINIEQERINNAYTRIEPLIAEQNKIITDLKNFYNQELKKVDTDLTTIKNYIDSDQIAKAQGLVGTKADGKYGPATAIAFSKYQEQKNIERANWLDKIQNSEQSPEIVAAKQEITKLRNQVEKEISESNKLIAQYQKKLQNTETADAGDLIAQELQKISINNNLIDKLTTEKYAIESDYRKLEAEVGPIKYIAEFVYGEKADKDLLEKAVKWVIIILIFVFDPLAVLLLIAANMTLMNRKKWIPNEEVNLSTILYNTIPDKPNTQDINTIVEPNSEPVTQQEVQELTTEEKQIIHENLDNPDKIVNEIIKEPKKKGTKVFLNRPAN